MNNQAAQNPSLPALASECSVNRLALFSRKPSAVMAANMIDFARELLLVREDMTQRQSDFWVFELSFYPPHLIQQAFHQWVKNKKFMPIPSEILDILDRMVEGERQQRIAGETKVYLEECRQIRERLQAAGEPSGLEQYRSLMDQALRRIKSHAPLPDPNRRMELKDRLARAQLERSARKKPPACANIRTGEAGCRNEANIA
jgi:hypothetical protein